MNTCRHLPKSIVLTWLVLGLGLAAAPLDIQLKSPTDNTVFRLEEAKGKFVALHFLLQTECPYCLKHTREYASQASSTPDVLHIFIKPDSEAEIKEWAGKLGSQPALPIYRDPEAQLAEQFKIPGGYPFHGQSVHYPALIILDPTGQEVFRYVGKNNGDRYSVAQFKAKLAQLKGKEVAIPQYNLGPDRLALSGYDPVSYLNQGRAEKGKPQFKIEYRGIHYQFASPENMAAFNSAPEKYLPAYGGWCATAMAKGEKVEIDPTNFKVTNGRLFLFFKAFYANALKDWNKDEASLTTQADVHWHKIAGE